ncbi:MAG: AEC family transporter [Patescibacteria group bacterium]|nr:AEC family transporter [Patescibacteria group bacterium]
MLDILLVIAPLFLIIFVSAIFQKIKKVGPEWSKVLNAFALNVGLPALIFSSLSKLDLSFAQESGIIVANSIFLVVSFIFAYIVARLLRFSQKALRTFFICFAFGSIAYMGIPTITRIMGPEILPSLSLIIAVYLFWVFTLGLGFLEYSRQADHQHVFRKIFSSFKSDPLLIAIFLGLLVWLLDLPLPTMVIEAVDLLAASVIPMVLVAMGLFMGNSQIGRLKEWLPVLAFAILTLFLLPWVFLLGVNIFGLSIEKYTPSILEAAMPLAISPFALADKFGLDKKFIARAVVLSTILSIFSLPFWASFIGLA